MIGAGRQEEIEKFLADLRARGRSEHSERSYAKGLDHFCAWLVRNDVDLDEVTKSHLTTYIADFAPEPKAGATAGAWRGCAGLAKARKRGEPAGQIAARELEVERITSALRRARELADDAAAAIEASAR